MAKNLITRFIQQLRTTHQCPKNDVNTVKTAALIVIGDEILKGDVIDKNSPLVIQEFYNKGIRLKRISIIGDDVNEIADEVRKCSKNYNYVISTGGVGCTHDDVTFEGVAKAFNEPLALNPVLRKLCENFFRTKDIKHPGFKMAMVPASSVVTYDDNNLFPNVAVRNVFIFPGVPQFFIKAFSHVSKETFKSAAKFIKRHVFLTVEENEISEILWDLAKTYKNVEVGSYPQWTDKSYRVRITLEGTEEKMVEEVLKSLLQNVKSDYIVKIV